MSEHTRDVSKLSTVGAGMLALPSEIRVFHRNAISVRAEAPSLGEHLKRNLGTCAIICATLTAGVVARPYVIEALDIPENVQFVPDDTPEPLLNGVPFYNPDKPGE